MFWEESAGSPCSHRAHEIVSPGFDFLCSATQALTAWCRHGPRGPCYCFCCLQTLASSPGAVFVFCFCFSDVQNASTKRPWKLPVKFQRKVYEARKCVIESESLQEATEKMICKRVREENPWSLEMPGMWDTSWRMLQSANRVQEGGHVHYSHKAREARLPLWSHPHPVITYPEC